MKNARFFFVLSTGIALAAACGGSTSSNNNNTGGDSGLSGSSSSGNSGGTSGSSSGSGSDAMATSEGGAGGCQCAAPEICCVTAGRGGFGGGRTFSCAAAGACAAGSLAVACTGTQSCGAGEHCCYLPSANTPSTTNISECASSCPAGARQTCTTDANCPTGSTCEQQTGGAYGFMTCHVAPPCMGTTDCAMGQVCCESAVTNTCQTGTACPAGSPQVCGAPSDCATGQVCCSSPADGGGSSTCQTGSTCPSGTSLICATSADCGMGLVCCEGGGQTCQMQSACGMPGNREICATAADCPAAFPVCRGMTCRAAPDGGVPPDGGSPVDAAIGG